MFSMPMIKVLQGLLFQYGLKELGAAIHYYKQGKKKWAIVSLLLGVFFCAFVILEWLEK